MTAKLAVFLHELRTSRGYSLRDLSALCGVSASTLSRIEGGDDFHISALFAIAEAFDMHAGDLLVEAGYSNGADVPYDAAAALARRALRVGLQSIGAHGD